jgi:hypothetical protein
MLLFVLAGCALPKNPVAVNALVEPSYVRPADADGRLIPQSYVFVAGRHFGGLIRSPVLDKVKLEDLLPALAAALRHQNYIPAQDPNKADLIIVVHWGVADVLGDSVLVEKLYSEISSGYDQYVGTIQASLETSGSIIADPNPLNQSMGELQMEASARDVGMEKTAALLGYTRTLAQLAEKPFSSAEEDSLRADLSESRYLVVLSAYGREPVNTGKRRRLWVTRLSMRAPGTNFVEAFPKMMLTGRQVFGRETDGIVRVQPGAPVGRVRLGELQVIETVSRERTKREEETAEQKESASPSATPAVP